MKYIKSGKFTTEQLSISEIITETEDVINIAHNVLEKITNISQGANKELSLAINNLNQATNYLKHIKRKTNIALGYVPTDIQEKEYL